VKPSIGENLELVPISLVGEVREGTYTRVGKSAMNLTRRSKSTTSDVACGNCGKSKHLRWDYLKVENKMGKGIKVEFTNDIVAIVDGVLNGDDCLSVIGIHCLMDGFLILLFTSHYSKQELLYYLFEST